MTVQISVLQGNQYAAMQQAKMVWSRFKKE